MGRDVYTLSDALQFGQIVLVQCSACAVKRYYDPADLIRLMGDLPTHMVDRQMKCERCSTRDHLRVDIQRLSAADRQTIKLRRIDSIRWVRRIIWRDEP
jgi:hypothetical protein